MYPQKAPYERCTFTNYLKNRLRYPGFGIVVSRRLQGVSREYKGDITQNIPGVALKFLIWEWGGINEGWHKVFENGGGIKGVA